jgi:hypothetical protein
MRVNPPDLKNGGLETHPTKYCHLDLEKKLESNNCVILLSYMLNGFRAYGYGGHGHLNQDAI